MPCYSTVTKTQMKDTARLAEALKALGYEVQQDKFYVYGRGGTAGALSFDRQREDSAFATTNTNLGAIKEVQRKYSELAVRELAKKKGFSVIQEGRKLTLINRRGK